MKKKVFYSLIFCGVLSALFLASVKNVNAAGWLTQHRGGSVSCGVNEARINLKTYKKTSDTLVNVSKISVKIQKFSDGSVVRSTSSSGSSGIPKTLCWNPYTQYIGISVIGGSTWRDFGLAFTSKTPANHAGQRTTFHVHLVRDSDNTFPATLTSPADGTWYKSVPTAKLKINYLLHGATRITQICPYGLPGVSCKTGSWAAGATVSFSLSGASDGWYGWNAFMYDNRADQGVTDWAAPWEGFGIDRASPINVSANHSPASPNNTQVVTFTGRAQDTLSGLDWTQIWARRVAPTVGSWVRQGTTCQYNGTTSLQSCVRSGGPWATGTQIQYFARARDIAGNQRDSVIRSFTVRAATGVIQGRFWRDNNANGTQDAGEPLIRNNSAMACAGYTNSTVRVNISGVGNRYPTRCISGGPAYYSGNIAIGSHTLTATAPAGWEVTTTNPRSVTLTVGQTRNIWFGMRPIPPGCLITVTPTPQTIEQSEFAIYNIEVSSVAGFVGDVDLSTNDLSSDEITLTLADSTVTLVSGGGAILPGVTTVTADTTFTTPVGTYDIKIEGESDEDTGQSNDDEEVKCEATAKLIVEEFQSDPWLKTTGGDVGSFSNINMIRDAPADGLINADYLVISDSTINKFVTAGWRIDNYTGGLILDPDPTITTMYDTLWGLYGPDSEGASNAALTQLNQGAMVSTVVSDGGIMEWGAGDIAGVNLSNYNGHPAVIFVDGSMTIDNNLGINPDTGIIFIVKGNITVNRGVTEIDGVFITNGVFNSRDATTCGSLDHLPYDDQLVINGAIHAFGELCFTRHLGGVSNLTTPAELINYEPKYLYLFQEIVGDHTVIYREVAP